MAKSEIDNLIDLISILPGLGKRSARRIALYMLQKPHNVLTPIINSLIDVKENVKTCPVCGNLDVQEVCSICKDPTRENVLCIIEDVSALWAMERSKIFQGKYHVLGGILSAIDGINPQDLNIESLVERIKKENITEVIFALPVTIEGKTTVHYIKDALKDLNVKMSELATGVPIGSELDYLDEGTIEEALKSRKLL